MDLTPYSKKCEILSELWIKYKTDPQFSDFITYNDLGLPLAYAVANNIVESTEIVESFIVETFSLLLSGIGSEDIGFDSLTELFSIVVVEEEE
jgi:hypothetical protein